MDPIYTLRQSLIKTIQNNCLQLQLDPYIPGAICITESSGGSYAARFEPNWKYFSNIEANAKKVGCTEDTERTLQMLSMGPLQCMGAVARELGLTAPLGLLMTDDVGIEYGCKNIKRLAVKYPDINDIFAAYNAGTPHKDETGHYTNQSYVDKCLYWYTEFKKQRLFQNNLKQS